MIPPSWRICDECPSKQDVEHDDRGWLCFECRLRYEGSPAPASPASSKLVLLVLLVVGCAGSSTTREAPAPACVEVEWSLDYCEGRRYPQTVFLDCAEPPRESCAPAERSGEPDVWCCW